MTQTEWLIELFRRNGFRLTLGQIMRSTLAAEYRARMSELRQKGFVITVQRGTIPSENVYTMECPDPSGQMRFA